MDAQDFDPTSPSLKKHNILSLEMVSATHCLLHIIGFGNFVRAVTIARVVGRGLGHRPIGCRHTCCDTQSSASLLPIPTESYVQCMYQRANYQQPYPHRRSWAFTSTGKSSIPRVGCQVPLNNIYWGVWIKFSFKWVQFTVQKKKIFKKRCKA